jgi:hypothetical protein
LISRIDYRITRSLFGQLHQKEVVNMIGIARFWLADEGIWLYYTYRFKNKEEYRLYNIVTLLMQINPFQKVYTSISDRDSPSLFF